MKRSFPFAPRSRTLARRLGLAGSAAAIAVGLGSAAIARTEPTVAGRAGSPGTPGRAPTAIADALPEEFTAPYLTQCRRSAMQSPEFSANFTEAQAAQYCQCTLDRIEAQYTLADLMNLYARANRDRAEGQQFPPELVEIARGCVQEMTGSTAP